MKLSLRKRNELHNKANVVLVGSIGTKYKKGKPTNEKARRIYVSKKVPESKLLPKDKIPKTINKIKTDVIVVGKFELGGKIPKKNFVGKIIDKIKGVPDRTKKIRPIKGGYSEGNASVNGAGTGAIMIKTTNDPFTMYAKSESLLQISSIKPNTRYRISNGHVYAYNIRKDMSEQKDLRIVQPGIYDGGNSNNDVCGEMVSFMKMEEGHPVTVDTALRTCMDDESPEVEGIGVPSDFITFFEDDKIITSGRTLGLSKATIIDESVSVRINYEGKPQTILDCYLSTYCLAPGQSGSAVFIDDGTKRIGAQGFAGSDTHSVHIKISNIRKIWNFTLVTDEEPQKPENEMRIDFFVEKINETTGNIYGYVTDKANNVPVLSACMKLDGHPDVYTNDDGYFKFKDIKSGRYTINFIKNGYKPVSKEFDTKW